MSELLVSRVQLGRFHMVCFIIGALLSINSFWFTPFASFSLVSSTLTVLTVLAIVVGILNGVGYFVLVNSKTSKHKQFSALSFPLAVVVSVLATYIVVILFGAPLLTKVSETFHLACLIATCSILPFISAAQRSWDIWVKIIFVQNTKMNMFEWNLLSCVTFPLIGSLIGAFFIPLDWDRPWQKWPVTCAAGCMLGYTAAHLFCLLKMYNLLPYKAAVKWKFF